MENNLNEEQFPKKLEFEEEYEGLLKRRDSIKQYIQDITKLLSEKKGRKKILLGVLVDIQKNKKIKYFLSFAFEPLLIQSFKLSIDKEDFNTFLITHQGFVKELSRNKFISDALLPEYVSFNSDLLTIEDEIESLEFLLRKMSLELDNTMIRMRYIESFLDVNQFLKEHGMIASILGSEQPEPPKVKSIGTMPGSETL